jgi:hypothetical protein
MWVLGILQLHAQNVSERQGTHFCLPSLITLCAKEVRLQQHITSLCTQPKRRNINITSFFSLSTDLIIFQLDAQNVRKRRGTQFCLLAQFYNTLY